MTQLAIDAVDAGGIPVTLIEIDLADGTTFRASDAGRESETAPYPPFVESWTPIPHGVSNKDGRLQRLEAVVRVIDPEPRTLTKQLTGENGRLVRGSVSRLRAAVKGLAESEWWPRLTGIVQDWNRPEPFIFDFMLRSTADNPLRGAGNQLLLTRDDFDTAPESSIGQPVPIVLGVHDSTGTNVNGMLKTIRCSTDGDPRDHTTKPVRYLISAGRLPDVQRVWDDGVGPTTVGAIGTDWFQEARNGRPFTTVGFVTGSDPGESAVITVDAFGLAELTPRPGEVSASDDSTISKNAAKQLRLWLTNFVFNDYFRSDTAISATAWLDPYTTTPLHRESWDETIAYFERKEMFGARAVPGDQDVDKTLGEFAKSWGVQYFIDDAGQLGINVNDPHTMKSAVYPALVFGRSDMKGTKLPALVSDQKRQFDSVRYQSFFSEAEERFLAARVARDPHRNVNRELVFDMPWSGAKLPSL